MHRFTLVGPFAVAMSLLPAMALAQQDGSADADNPEFWRNLDLDPASLNAPVKSLPAPRALIESKDADVKRTDNSDGTSSISINKPLPTTWDTKVGSDLGFRDRSAMDFDPTRPFAGTGADQQTRAVWGSVAVPDVASLSTRIDSSEDQGKLGASIERSVPLGRHLSVTVQDNYSVAEANGAAPVSSPVPLASVPTSPGAPVPAQVWGNERQVKLNVLPTGTTFGAGWTTVTGDPVTHNTFSADQTLYGALHVTTSVTDPGRPTSSKSITAGFKMNW